MLILPLLLFVVLAGGGTALVVVLAARGRSMPSVERLRLLFVFGACLTVACWVPLWMARPWPWTLWVAGACAEAVNLLGIFLSLCWSRRQRRGSSSVQPAYPQPQEDGPRVRVYTVYYEGKPLGLVTKGAFLKLGELGLLKRQRTVELVRDYQRRARRRGATVRLVESRDGTQALISVVMDRPET